MQLSKLGYYSDFFVYPAVISTLAAFDIAHNTPLGAAKWLGAVALGATGWTLLEYFLHRITLHGMTYFAPMHGQHHAAPLAFIGTPTWVSVTVLSGGVLVPAWLCLGFNAADGLTVGVMLGYCWFGIVHHVIHHHAHKATARYFNELRAWHMRHHYSPKAGNFGVTTPLWDYVFGTAIQVRDRAAVTS